MSSWRPQGGPAAQPSSRRLAFRPRLQPLEDRSVPSVTTPTPTATDPNAPPNPPDTPTTPTTPAIVAPPIYAVGADAGNLPVVKVYDTTDHSVKYSFEAYDKSFRGGVRVATGDVTGDGVMDIVTAPGKGMKPIVKVYDGSSGELLNSFSAYDDALKTGVFVAVADVNGDGYADVVTAPDGGGGPHVKVFNGTWIVPPINAAPTAASIGQVTLREFMAYDVAFRGGVRVAAADINGDGKAEIITGAGSGGGPHVKIFDGATGDVAASFFAFKSTFTGGVFVTAGDIDADGKAELAVGAGQLGGTQTRLYDDNGSLLRTYTIDARNPGGVRVSMVDIDGDNRKELITAVGTKVQIRNPVNNAVKKSFTPFEKLTLGGVFVG